MKYTERLRIAIVFIISLISPSIIYLLITAKPIFPLVNNPDWFLSNAIGNSVACLALILIIRVLDNRCGSEKSYISTIGMVASLVINIIPFAVDIGVPVIGFPLYINFFEVLIIATVVIACIKLMDRKRRVK